MALDLSTTTGKVADFLSCLQFNVQEASEGLIAERSLPSGAPVYVVRFEDEDTVDKSPSASYFDFFRPRPASEPRTKRSIIVSQSLKLLGTKHESEIRDALRRKVSVLDLV